MIILEIWRNMEFHRGHVLQMPQGIFDEPFRKFAFIWLYLRKTKWRNIGLIFFFCEKENLNKVVDRILHWSKH